MPPITATLYTDPGCPWAYSAIPALRVMEWRYGDGLRWRLVMIGLAEDPSRYLSRGYTPESVLAGHAVFRDRFGMPFSLPRKGRVTATGRGCRAVVAARLRDPGSEWAVLRALQIANFTSPLMLDDDASVAAALDAAGLDGAGLVEAIADPEVEAAYQADRAEARAAGGSAAELQGKTATTDGPVRFTAPSVVFARDGARLVAGGWQPVEAYDVLVANLDPSLPRQAPPPDPGPLLERWPEGLVTREVALLMTRGNDAVDEAAAERALGDLVAAGRATRTTLGQSALWRAA
ncbi:MAG: DsbA family protein [Thermoleophilia bacterium]